MTQSTIPMTLTPQSQQIHGYGYDEVTQTLAVEYATNHGELTYHYKEVPPQEAQGLDAAESKGAFILRRIKGKYDFERVPKQAAAQQQA